MPLRLGQTEALINAIARTPRKIIFLVGSPLSMPRRSDEPGVPGTIGILGLIAQQAISANLQLQYEAALGAGDSAGKYQRAMVFLQEWLSQDYCNAVVQDAVRQARRPGVASLATFKELEDDLDGWYINEGTQALADLLVVRARENLSSLVLTPNFDPLLSVAIRRAGGVAHRIILDSDGRLGQGQIDAQVCTVVHFHGYWHGPIDTMHTPSQLLTPRPALIEALARLVKDCMVVSVAYGGWDDVFTRALARANEGSDAIDLRWATNETDEVVAEARLSLVRERLGVMINRGRVQFYGGVDCHDFFTSLRERLCPRNTTPLVPMGSSPGTTGQGTTGPGAADPGATGPGTTGPGTTGPGTTDPGMTVLSTGPAAPETTGSVPDTGQGTAGPGTTSEVTSNEAPGSRYSIERAPFNVPFEAKGDQMVGRPLLLEQVWEKLQQTPRTRIGQAASFQGLGGLGKTQTAVEYAHRYRDQYPGGVVWLNADQDIDAQLTHLAVTAGWVAPESEHHFKLDVARSRLKNYSQVLLILDNVEDLTRLKPYLPAPGAGVHILATCRDEIPAFVPIDLDPLNSREALTLLLQESGRELTSAAESEAASTIVAVLDGLPLALEIAGAYLRHRSAISLRQYLDLMTGGLTEAMPGQFLESGTGHGADLGTTLRLSERLLAEQPRLRMILTVMVEFAPASIGLELLAALIGEPQSALLHDPLSLGLKLRILRHDDSGVERYRLHRLVWTVLRPDYRAQGDQQRDLGKRLVDWLRTVREDPADLAKFEAEVDHLHEWERTVQKAGWAEEEVYCLWLQAYPPFHRGQFSVAQDWIHRAFTLYHQKEVHNEALLADLFSDDAALISDEQTELKRGLSQAMSALTLRRQVRGEEHYETAISLNNVGGIYFDMNEYGKALEHHEKALAVMLRVRGEEHRMTAICWNNLCGDYRGIRRYDKALECIKKALAITRRVLGEEHPFTATCWKNAGGIYTNIGQYDEALKCRLKALAIAHRVLGNEHLTTAACEAGLGNTYQKMRVHSKALEYYERALTIMRRVLGQEHPRTLNLLHQTVFCLSELGNHYLARDRLQKILKCTSLDKTFRKRLLDDLNSLHVPGFRQPKKKKKRG